MPSLDDLVKTKELLLDRWFDFDPDFARMEDYDVNLLYAAAKMSKFFILLTNIIEKKIGDMAVYGAEKVDLDLFSSDTYILIGENIHSVKEKIINSGRDGPFSCMQTESSGIYGSGNDFIYLETKLECPHLDGILINPTLYHDAYKFEYDFCINHLWFRPSTSIFFDGNIAQTNYVSAIRSVLDYFMKEQLPFALFGYNSLLDPDRLYVVGGVNGHRKYRHNPDFATGREERVWLHVMDKMLPRYSSD